MQSRENRAFGEPTAFLR